MEKLYKYFSIIIDITSKRCLFMGQVWAYLNDLETKDYREIAKSLSMTEGELTQFLIRMLLKIPDDCFQPANCIKCQYYQIATSNVIQAFMKLNEALSLVAPSYKKMK